MIEKKIENDCLFDRAKCSNVFRENGKREITGVGVESTNSQNQCISTFIICKTAVLWKPASFLKYLRKISPIAMMNCFIEF